MSWAAVQNDVFLMKIFHNCLGIVRLDHDYTRAVGGVVSNGQLQPFLSKAINEILCELRIPTVNPSDSDFVNAFLTT